MRQLGIILLSMGLAMLTSCSKNIDDDIGPYSPQMEETSALIAPEGTFEGEWKLSKYEKTCKGQIEVKGDEIAFDVPADYLFPRLGFVTEDRKAMYPEEPLFAVAPEQLTYFDTQQTMQYTKQGYSDSAIYGILSNTVAKDYDIPADNLPPSFGLRAGGTDYSVKLVSIKEQPTAVFNSETNLWTIALPIDMVAIQNTETLKLITSAFLDEEAPEKSAWLFVFRATKRIK